MVALVAQLAIYGIDKEVKLGFLRLGLFWHFLDIIWVAIFSVCLPWRTDMRDARDTGATERSRKHRSYLWDHGRRVAF